MKLLVAGKDRSADVGSGFPSRIAEMAAHPDVPYRLGPDRLPASALWLASSSSEREYMDRLIAISRTGVGIGALDFYIPRKPGPAGSMMAAIKRALWKLLKYQHDEFSFHQTAVNVQLVSLVEFMREEHRREVGLLEGRIAELEKGGTGGSRE